MIILSFRVSWLSQIGTAPYTMTASSRRVACACLTVLVIELLFNSDVVNRPRGVTVSTLDSESSDRGSNPREVWGREHRGGGRGVEADLGGRARGRQGDLAGGFK